MADLGLLRQALMTGIQEYVHFGKHFKSFGTNDDGIQASFVDGSTEQGTLLVGADGVRSAVRKHFSLGYRFLDTESCCIYGKSFLNPELSERFDPEHRRWITIIRDQCRMLQSSITKTDSSMIMVCEGVIFPNRLA